MRSYGQTELKNICFMGTSVQSGTATAVFVATVFAPRVLAGPHRFTLDVLADSTAYTAYLHRSHTTGQGLVAQAEMDLKQLSSKCKIF